MASTWRSLAAQSVTTRQQGGTQMKSLFYFEGSGGDIHASWNTQLISSVLSYNTAAKMGGGWYRGRSLK